MYIQQVNQDGVSIALIRSEKPLMTDVQSALDLMMTVRAETGCKRIALNREAIMGDFFVLSTGIASPPPATSFSSFHNSDFPSIIIPEWRRLIAFCFATHRPLVHIV